MHMVLIVAHILTQINSKSDVVYNIFRNFVPEMLTFYSYYTSLKSIFMKARTTILTRAVMLLLVALLGLNGARADVTSFPWTENFNSLTVNYSIPDGWDNSEGTTPGERYPWCYTTETNNAGYGACNGTSHDGSNCVRFNSNVNLDGYTNFLKTIPISLPATPNMELTFWYRNKTGGDFSVYISTDGGTTHNTALVTRLTGAENWTKISPISLSAYKGQTVVIVFKGTSNFGDGDAFIYLDDVTVKETIVCPVPTDLAATNITSNSADLGWVANSGETSWTLYYKKTADANYTPVTNVTSNPYSLTGLEPNTSYDFFVTFLCSETGSEVASQTYSFTTTWEPVATFPWTEDFNSLTQNGSIPNGWDNSEGTTTNDNYKWCYTTTSTAGYGACNGTSHDGTNCVRFESYNNNTDKTNFLKAHTPDSRLSLSSREHPTLATTMPTSTWTMSPWRKLPSAPLPLVLLPPTSCITLLTSAGRPTAAKTLGQSITRRPTKRTTPQCRT